MLERRAWDVDALLEPHNEHLSLVPVLIYKALFSTLGIDVLRAVPRRRRRRAPDRARAAVRVRAAAGRRRARARRRRRDRACFGPAWPDVLWPFQMGFLGSLAAGLGALLCLDRGDRAGEIGASALLTVALASSSMGIPIFIAAAFEMLGPAGPRARAGGSSPRPAVLYGVWYLGVRRRWQGERRQPALHAAYMAEAAAAAAGSVFGLGLEWGRPLVLATGALLVRGAPPRRGRPVAAGGADRAAARLLGPDRAGARRPARARRAALPLPRRALPAADRGRGGARRDGSRRGGVAALLVLLAVRDGGQPRRAAQRRGLPARPGRRARRRARRDAARGAERRAAGVPARAGASRRRSRGAVSRRGQGPRLARARGPRSCRGCSGAAARPPTAR